MTQKSIWQYLAPELFNRDRNHSKETDIYSLGIVLWELYTSKIPYQLSQLNSRDIIMGKREAIPPTVPQPIADMIKQCWSTDPYTRPSLDLMIDRLETILMQRQPSLEAEKLYRKAILTESNGQHALAYEFYNKADNLGHIKAKTSKALYLLTGRGAIQQDKKQAYKELLVSAQAGCERAQYNIAQMLEYGDGVPQDLGTALEFYQLAGQQGHAKAEQKVQTLKYKIDEQIKQDDNGDNKFVMGRNI